VTGSSRLVVAVLAAAAIALAAGGVSFADDPVLRLRVQPAGAGASAVTLTIELLRWSTEAERAPLMAALAAPPPEAPDEDEAGRGAGGGRGRGRGGRGAPPPSPMARLTTAVRAEPTVGFIWGDGPTGYSIKYAWRADQPDGRQRIVLATDRRFGAHVFPPPEGVDDPADAEFTLIELRLDASGGGEGRTSLATPVIVDAAADTLALGGDGSAPPELKVTR